jgi:hypothetical protein
MKTLRELIAGATPGPWGYDLNHTVGRHQDGEWQESVAQLPVGTHKRRPTAQEKADMLLIARCSPDTMLLVVEALETTAAYAKKNGFDVPLIQTALSTLNGQPAKNE